MNRLDKAAENAFLSPKKSAEAFAEDVGELRRLLDYNEETGQFHWRTPPPRARCVLGGALAGCISPGSNRSSGYRLITIHLHQYRAHILAWIYIHGKRPNGVIDHINGNRADNRRLNLRDVTRQVNRQNQRKPKAGSVTGIQGVGFNKKSEKYVANIKRPDGRAEYLGSYSTPDAAHKAYLTAKRRLHEGCTL